MNVLKKIIKGDKSPTLKLEKITSAGQYTPRNGGFRLIEKSARDKKCTKSSITKELKEYLNKGYHDKHYVSKLTFVNKYKFDKITIQTNLSNTLFIEELKTLYARLKEMSRGSFFGLTASKYKNTKLISATQDGIKYSSYDLFGRERIKTESANTVIQYGKDMYKKHNQSFPFNNLQNGKEINIKVVVSSKLSDKLESIKIADKLGVCQHFGNTECGGLAVGYYDYFVNQAAPTLMLYINGQLLGRSACRLMYNEAGKEYLFFERFYVTGLATQYYSEIISRIGGALSKKIPLVITNVTSSGRQSELFRGAKDAGVETSQLKEILRGPRRYLSPNSRTGYYRDSNMFGVSDDSYVTGYEVAIPTCIKLPVIPNREYYLQTEFFTIN